MATRSSISRFYLSILSLIVLSLFVYSLATLISYFHSSTAELNKYDLGLNQLAEHQPMVTWLPDNADLRGEINPYIRSDIEKAYVDAWGILNLSILNQTDLGLNENWSDRKTEQLRQALSSENIIDRKDLHHNIKLHFISLDKQVVSFTDERVATKTKVKWQGQETIYTDTSDYKVLMTLDDGKWRVNKMVRMK